MPTPTSPGLEHDHDTTGPRQRRVILLICSLSVFMIYLDNTILNVALPAMQSHLHAQVSALQWVVDAYLLVLAGCLLLGGTSADRLGRRRVSTAVFWYPLVAR